MQGARRCLGECAHGHDLATVLTRGPCPLLELCADDFFVYFGSTARLWEFSTFAFFSLKIPLALLLCPFAFAFVFIV